jgi:hypothetical protein
MPDPSSNSYVTDATFGGGKITLTVRVDNFSPGDYVEISGHATQSSGAFANYYSIEEVPNPTNTVAVNTVTVTAVPVPPQRFIPWEDVTVVVRVAKIWVTVLGGASQPGTPTRPPAVTPPQTVWNVIRQVTDMKGNFDYT